MTDTKELPKAVVERMEKWLREYQSSGMGTVVPSYRTTYLAGAKEALPLVEALESVPMAHDYECNENGVSKCTCWVGKCDQALKNWRGE